MIQRTALRLLRKLLLGYGKRIDKEKMLLRSRSSAVRVALQAAKHSAAYRTLLQENGTSIASLTANMALDRLPVLTKDNTFARFSLTEMARPVPEHQLADVLTSSGRGGRTFGFRLTTRKQYESSWFDIDLGLQDVFDVDTHSALLVNCLPMGVVFASRAVTVSNVSVREDMACSILRHVGPRFAQTLVCCDPLFVRQLLLEGERTGVDWKALNTSLIMGEEVLVESQREYIAAKMGMDIDNDPHRMIASSYGAAELGLNLLFETRDTIRLRRAMRSHAGLRNLLGTQAGAQFMPSLFCFNPMRCHIEVLNPDAEGYGELCFTLLDPNAVIPLPRYATGDWGKILENLKVEQACHLAHCNAPWLPMVALQGRINDRPLGIPSVEEVKELIYSMPDLADDLSGAFTLSKQNSGVTTLLTLQLRQGVRQIDPVLVNAFQDLLNADACWFPVTMDFHAADPAGWSPLLDYERKFSYVR